MRWKVIVWPIGILVIGFILMQVLLSLRSEPPRRIPQARAKIVKADVVQLNPVASSIIAFGRLTTAQPVVLYSEVNGVLMPGDVTFQPAQSFQKGDLLLKVDDRQARLELNSAKSDLLTALAIVLPEIKVDFPEEYQIWQAYFDKFTFDNKLETLPETKNQKIKLYLSRFNVFKLYFQVRNLEILLNKHYFYAPFSGSIVSADLRVGSTARGGTRLGELINLENLEVEVPVPSPDIRWIDRDRPVLFTSTEIEGEWKGRIKRIGKTIDQRTQSLQVFMTVNKNGEEGLYNGVFLRAEIPGLVIPNSFVIPRKALYNEKYVYLIKLVRLDYREVEIARKEADSIILTGGIQNGDTLVTDVLQGVAPGMPASVRMDAEEDI
ncbi:MAG: efflux RND transporter periplasmic adaptor subunit [Anaerolineales bacterium]